MEILEVLKYTLPALIVFLTAYFLIRAFIRSDQDKRKHEIILQNQKNVLLSDCKHMSELYFFSKGFRLNLLLCEPASKG